MIRIQVCCPTCKKIGYIEVTEEAIKEFSRGLLAVNIAENTICSHSFIAYVDKNFNIRDYFIADFKIELPEVSREEKVKAQRISGKDIIDIDLIKLNLTATLITYILKSIFFKKKVVIILDQSFLYEHVSNFFKYITKSSFDSDVSIISNEEYKNNQKEYKKGYMVFKGSEILNNIDKIIDPKKLKVEKQMVQNFLNETELGYSYIGLRNNVLKTFELCKEIMKLIENYEKSGKKEKLGKKQLINMLAKTTEIKISIPYLEFLLDIIRNYFKFDLSGLSDYIFPALGI